MKILIVEDNGSMRAFIKKIIEQNINHVEAIYESDDGDQAVELYRHYRPDWVLMDIQLKTVDGLTATRTILNDDPSAKVIMMTQYDDQEYRKMAENAGVVAYILKENLLDLLKIIN